MSIFLQVTRNLGPVHQLLDLHGVFQRVVRREGQFWRDAQSYGLGDLTPQVRRRARQSRNKCVGVGAAKARKEDSRTLQVRTDSDFRNRHMGVGQIRIAEVATFKDSGQDVADFFRHA